MTALLTAMLALLPPQAGHYPLPSDPLQRVAERAIRGEFGTLREWQRHWYTVALLSEPERRRVWLTQYGPWEGFAGDNYHVAANPRYMALGTVVWVSKPGQLRVVTNRGAGYNDRVATAGTDEWVVLKGHRVRGKGCDQWMDLWTEYRGQYGLDTTTANVYVLGRADGWR